VLEVAYYFSKEIILNKEGYDCRLQKYKD